jgi:ATP-dependent helicase/DNAse subunit B
MEISYTMMSNFTRCEYLYYLRYIKRLPVKESSASIYGTAVHRAIKGGYDASLDNADKWASLFKAEWVSLASNKDIVFFSEGEYIRKFKSGQELLRKYYDEFVTGYEPPIATEYFFGRSNQVKIGEHTIVGVFDQIDANNNIIDYKTSPKPSQLELSLDLQFTIYSYAYRQLFNKEENGLLLRHLGTMKDVATTRSESDFAILKEEIDKVDKKLRGKVFVRNVCRDCATCYFLTECLGKTREFGKW